MKKKYATVILNHGELQSPELKIGLETFKRVGILQKPCMTETCYAKEVVGFREAHKCMELALWNALKQGLSVSGLVVEAPATDIDGLIS